MPAFEILLTKADWSRAHLISGEYSVTNASAVGHDEREVEAVSQRVLDAAGNGVRAKALRSGHAAFDNFELHPRFSGAGGNSFIFGHVRR
jgi:hypothetical protein